MSLPNFFYDVLGYFIAQKYYPRDKRREALNDQPNKLISSIKTKIILLKIFQMK